MNIIFSENDEKYLNEVLPLNIYLRVLKNKIMCVWCHILEECPDGLSGESWDLNRIAERICFNFVETHSEGFDMKPWNAFSLIWNSHLSWDYHGKIIL